MTYKLYKTFPHGKDAAIKTNDDGSTVSFIFNSANTDYQAFKSAINAQTAQLEDADGNLMTPEQAITYVGTLP